MHHHIAQQGQRQPQQKLKLLLPIVMNLLLNIAKVILLAVVLMEVVILESRK